MQTCTGERVTSLTLEDLSRVHDLAVEAAQNDACRFLECLFPDAEIDPEKEYLLLIDWHPTAKQVGIPFGSWPLGDDEVRIFGKLTIRCCRYIPHGTIYLIENELGQQWRES